MKEILAAIMLAASNLQGGQPASDPSNQMLADISRSIHLGKMVAIGYCAKVPDGGDGDILFGANTTAPQGVPGFVNIGNVWCGLRSTEARVDCPPPTKCEHP